MKQDDRASQVGISQRIRVEWLDATVNLVLAGNGSAAIQECLHRMLAEKLSVGSDAARGSRQKAVTILMKVWRNVPPGLEPLRDAGLKLYPALDADHCHALHWGMTMAAYPFWGTVAAQTGRLLRLQGTARAAQVQRRIRERHGERQTVARATARVLRSYVDWNVLADTETKGVYALGAKREIEKPEVAAWLCEAMLRTRAATVARTNGLLGHTAFFAYGLPPLTAWQLAAQSSRLEASRQALDEEVLMLRSEAPERALAFAPTPQNT